MDKFVPRKEFSGPGIGRACQVRVIRPIPARRRNRLPDAPVMNEIMQKHEALGKCTIIEQNGWQYTLCPDHGRNGMGYPAGVSRCNNF